MSKQIAISFITVLFIVLFFRMPPYNKWVNDKVLSLNGRIYEELDSLSLEDRKAIRWEGAYTSTKALGEYIDSMHFKQPLLLIPPQKYFDDNHIPIIMPEPIVFYYFCGLKTVLPTSKYLYKANFGVFVDKDRTMTLHEIKRKENIDTLLLSYKIVY